MVLLYWALPLRAQNIWLLLTSYYFYSCSTPWTAGLICIVSLINFAAAIMLEKYHHRRIAITVLSLALSSSFLLWFKYALFVLSNLAAAFPSVPVPSDIFLPAGISFFTFQAMAYTGDVFRGRIKAERSVVNYLLFISFFPQLVAGPIERAENLLNRVRTARQWDSGQFMRGIDLLLLGYVKKVVIADNIAIYINMIFDLKEPSTLLIMTGAIGFNIQILADFSSYTDIARGCARLMGFELMENFRHPYLARSPAEFWKRWHISLSNLIKEYLYIPLGGSRVSHPRWIFNIILVWTVCGTWHGAGWNFILWGFYWGVMSVCYRYVSIFPDRPWTNIPRIVIFHFWTTIGRLFFRVGELSLLGGYFSMNAMRLSAQQLSVCLAIMGIFALYAAPLVIAHALENSVIRAFTDPVKRFSIRMFSYTLAAIMLIMFAAEEASDFYYFQF